MDEKEDNAKDKREWRVIIILNHVHGPDSKATVCLCPISMMEFRYVEPKVSL